MKKCAYCEEVATHHGEGEDVCEKHIHLDAKDEYKATVRNNEIGSDMRESIHPDMTDDEVEDFVNRPDVKRTIKWEYLLDEELLLEHIVRQHGVPRFAATGVIKSTLRIAHINSHEKNDPTTIGHDHA